MSKHKYTSMHDLKDIAMIYKDCPDYKLKIWNFTDRHHMRLSFDSMHVKDVVEDQCVMFMAHPVKDSEPMGLETLGDLQTFLKKTDDGSMEYDDAEMVVFNPVYNQLMRVYFIGSSNVEKVINFNCVYLDPNFHKWKHDLYLRWLTFKWKFKKLFHLK